VSVTGTLGRGQALALHEDVVRTVLPNGLTVLVRRDEAAPVVGIVTHVKAGYFDEPDDLVGIAHVLEHMYFKGTPTRGVGDIAKETKRAGGWLNAHTIYDHTAYVTVLPSAAFVRGLDIQFDAFAHSLVDAGELGRELEVIVQEARRKRDAPGAVTIESLFALLHDRHRIRRWRIGEPEQLRTFTRAQVHGFYRQWYTPANTILSVVGAVDPDAVLDAVALRHGTLAAAPMVRDRGPRETQAPGVRVRQLAGDIAQAHAAFGWRTPSVHHADAAALDLAGLVLGSGRASRLNRAVRERQLASGVSAYHYTTDDLGVFVAHVEAPAGTWQEAVRATWREVQALRQRGAHGAEIVRAQRVLEARWLRRLETMDGQAAYLASWEAEGGVALGARYFEQLQASTAGDVQRVVATHLDPAQVALLAYRPHAAAALPDDAEALATWLDAAAGGTVASAPAASAPAASAPAVGDDPDGADAPAVHVGTRPEADIGGVQLYRTRSGVPVLVRTRPGSRLVNLGVFTRAGAVAEPEGVSGVARLMAHTTLKGTRRRRGDEIALEAESMGGSIGVSAGLESLGWTLSVPASRFTPALALLGDVVLHPIFPDDGLETERALAIAELARLRDDMYRSPMRLATEAAYAGHPYARNVVGTEIALAAITRDDVQVMHAQAITCGAATVGIVGPIEGAEALASVERHLGALVAGDDSAPPPARWPAEHRVRSESRDKQQTALAMLFRGPSRRDPARFAARVLAAVASGLGGRFFEQLRDRQSLAYTVAAYPIERRAGGSFAAYIATDPSREEEARAGLLAQFDALRAAPVQAEELARARAYLVGAHAIAQQSGASVLAEMVEAWLFGDGLSELIAVDARLQAVTAEAIQMLAQSSFEPAHRVEGVVQGHR
jgi:zinc protease